MDYSFKQKNKLWGLIDKNKNWVIKPQYHGIVYDEYIGPENIFIFKKLDKYYLYTTQLQNLYPEGITNYWFLNEDFNLSGYDKNEYAFLVRGKNGLYGVCFNYTKEYNNTTKNYSLFLDIQWEEIFNFSDIGFDLIKSDELCHVYIYDGLVKFIIEDHAYRKIYPHFYYDFIKKYPNLELPEFWSKMSKSRFFILVNFYFNKPDYSNAQIQGYDEVSKWIENTFNKQCEPGFVDWLYLKLFEPNYDGVTLPRKYKRH